MKSLKLLTVFGLAAVIAAGCIFDNESDEDSEEPQTIADVNMGGGVFFIEGQGGFAQIGTFDKSLAPVDARVFVDGVELEQNGAIHSNESTLPFESMSADDMVRVVVYALGDSAVHELSIPEYPVIVQPEEGASVQAGSDLEVQIGFPGEHRYIAYTILEQDNYAVGVETNQTLLTQTIPGSRLQNTGTAYLNAYAVNTDGEIPEEFDLQNQHEIFLVATVGQRLIEFAGVE